MRILLDCHYLPEGPLRAEKCLFIGAVAPILSKKEGLEWLFLVDIAYSNEFQEVGQVLPISGAARSWVGRQWWKYWRLPGIVKKYKPDRVMTPGEMEGISGAADERYRPLAGQEKEEVKDRYTEGKEYFLADIGGMRKEQIVGLLKAFSLFKKRQRSNMRFVLRAGAVRGHRKGIPIDLQNYKYRSDICVLVEDPGEEEWIRLVSAAYVLVAPFDVEGPAVFNAWKAETPVIAAMSFQGTGVHAPGDPASLAALLMSLYTNEGMRSEWIGKGRDRLAGYSWERAAGQVWDRINAGGKSQ